MIQSINPGSLTIAHTPQRGSSLSFPTGGTFSARVAERHDAQHFLFQVMGSHVTFNASLAQDAQVGDVFEFEPIQNAQGQWALKLLNKTQGALNEMTSLSATDLKTLFEQSGFSREISLREYYINSGQLETDRQLTALKRQLTQDESLLTTGVVNQLLAKGVDLTAIDVTQIKTVSQQADPVLYVPTGHVVTDITGALNSHHLPVSTANVAKLERAYHYYEEAIAEGHPLSLANLLASDKPATLGNLYTVTVATPYYEPTVSAFEGLDQELIKLYNRQDLETTPENLAHGKHLYQAGAEITPAHIALLEDLPKLPYYPVLNAACEGLKQGMAVTDILLTDLPMQNAHVYQNYADTLGRLHAPDALTPTGELYQQFAQNEPADQALAQLTHQKNLAHIQLKLTTEAAYALASKGIDINILPAKQALEQLQQLEANAYEKLAHAKQVPAADIPAIQENLGQLYDSLSNLSPLYPQNYKHVVGNYQDFNITTLDQQATAAKLAAGYSVHMTSPQAKYGDSFAKVYDQLNAVVTGIGMPDSEENIRLASILSRAGMDVNVDNMLEAKVIHKKLDYVVDNLHPSVAIDMIQAGVNPLTTHLDNLITFIDTHYPLAERHSTKKLAEHILDIQDDVTPTERAQMMAIYRSLNQINTYGAVSLGINLQTGTELTLGHLLDAADYYQGAHRPNSQHSTYLDTTTEQTPTQTTPASTNIRQTLADISAKEAVLKLTPDKLAGADTQTPLSEIYNRENNQPTKLDTLLQTLVETAEQVGAIHLLKQAGEQATVQNINNLVMLIEQPNQLKTKLDKLKEQLDPDTLPTSPVVYLADDEAFDTLTENLEALKSLTSHPDTAETPTSYTHVDLKDVSILQNTLRFQQQLNPKAYTLPINLGGVVSTLQMQVNGRLSTASNIVIAIDTPQYGQVSTLLKTSGHHLDLFVSSENQAFLDKLTAEATVLGSYFETTGFLVKNVITATQITDTTTSNGAEPTTATYSTDALTRDGLFKLATCWVNYLNH